jgi:hypothetical protein
MKNTLPACLASRVYRAIVLLAALLSFMTTPALAETGGSDFERIMLKQFDYIFYCDMETLDHYLSYKGSTMAGPYVRIVITYQVTNSMGRMHQQATDPIKYEEIWYHAGKCVGLHRYQDIVLNPDYQGAIYFRGKDDTAVCDHTIDAVDCAVRLLMDIYVKRSILAGVIVPAACFEGVSSDLGQYNFFLLEEASGGKGENMSLHLEGYPRGGTERYFYYDDTGRR